MQRHRLISGVGLRATKRGRRGSLRNHRPRRRWVYSLLFGLSLALLMLDVSNHRVASDARRIITDLATPALGAASTVVQTARAWIAQTRTFAFLGQEVERLRNENRELRGWQRRARELETRTSRFEHMLKLQPDPTISAVGARAIADARSPFARTLIINAGREAGVGEGNAVIGAEGFVGRVVAAGERSARVLLVNDLASRIPVHVGAGRHRSILAGTNADEPALLFLPAGAKLQDGDLVVTSGEGRLLPPGLPVGEVRISGEAVSVALASDPASVEFVRVLDYRVPIDVADGAPPMPAAFGPASEVREAVTTIPVQAAAIQSADTIVPVAD